VFGCIYIIIILFGTPNIKKKMILIKNIESGKRIQKLSKKMFIFKDFESI
jgi:hypothetical protein